MQREPARRRKTRGALEVKAALGQGVGDEPLQILGRLRLHAGGDFFAEEFEKKFGHGLVGGAGKRRGSDRSGRASVHKG